MKRFMAIIFSLFLVSGLFAEWKEIEIPSTAVYTVQAFENDECVVVERNVPEQGHDILIVFKDKFFVDFEYSDVIMLSIKADDNFTRADAFTLIDMYGAQTGNLGE